MKQITKLNLADTAILITAVICVLALTTNWNETHDNPNPRTTAVINALTTSSTINTLSTASTTPVVYWWDYEGDTK